MEIFDAYVDDLIRQEKAKDKKGVKISSTQDEERKRPQSDFLSDDITRVTRASKVMERMVNQNTFDDIAQGKKEKSCLPFLYVDTNLFWRIDFKYYEDTGDEFREGQGSLLPLWRFKYDKANKTAITALRWNPLYTDLFAVAHGSCE